MIRFKQFLLQERELDFSDFVNAVKSDCRPFLKDIGDQPLLRGMRHTNYAFGHDVALETTAEILIYRGDGFYYASPASTARALNKGLGRFTGYKNTWNALREKLA